MVLALCGMLGLCPSQDPLAILTYSNIDNLHDCLLRIFRNLGPAEISRKFDERAMVQAVRFFSDHAKFVAVVASDVDADEQKLEQLTRLQWDAFRSVLANPRVRIEGVAGSGKTMIARWAAYALSERKMRVLLLCYNKFLVDWLRATSPENPLIDIKHFHGFCSELAIRAKIPFIIPAGDLERDEFFGAGAARIASDALSIAGDGMKYDAVIVDEGQDFHEDWWFVVQLSLRDPDHGPLYIFHDPDQRGVYGLGKSYPAGMPIFQLLENCRNTKAITGYCGSIIGKDLISSEMSPLGTVPCVFSAVDGVTARWSRIRDLMLEWLKEEIKPTRIALLSPWARTNLSSILSLPALTVGNVPIICGEGSIRKWMNAEGILGSTIKAFKGLEADCVIISDIPTIGVSHMELADLYVAATRAKHRLILLPSSSDAEKALKNWAAQCVVKPR